MAAGGDAEKLFPSLSSLGSTLGSDNFSSLGNQSPEWVNAEDQARFTCPACKEVLKLPRQTTCGHRICRDCVRSYLDGVKSLLCPVGESDCEHITEDNVIPDNSCVREMKKAPVYCTNKSAGCAQKIRFQDLKNHLQICDFETITCPHQSLGCTDKFERQKLEEHSKQCLYKPVQCDLCKEQVIISQLQNHKEEHCPEEITGCRFGCGNKTLKRKELENHKSVCPVQPIDCKFKHMGCAYGGKREMVEQHEKESLSSHLELIARNAAQMELKMLDMLRDLQRFTTERETIHQSLQSLREQDPGSVSQQLRDLRLKLVSAVERLIVLERRVPDLVDLRRFGEAERNITSILQRLEHLEQRGPQGGGGSGDGGGTFSIPRFGTVTEMANAFSTQLAAHDRQLGVHDVRMAEMDLRFQLLETASYDGTLIWKIRDFIRRKTDAVNGRTLSLYSQPFYSSRFGYKMCARVYLNGDGMGKTTHLSLFFVVMRGEYDALLNWPFRQKVTLTLLDQSESKRHLTDHFQPDPSSSSFQKPTGEMNVASGCPLFVSHSVLENPSNGYLKEDTIFIRIIVDPNLNPTVY